MAAVAARAQKTVLKATTFEVILELLFDVPGQRRILRLKVLLERRVVLINDLVKEGTLGAVAHVQPRTQAQTGFPASR